MVAVTALMALMAVMALMAARYVHGRHRTAAGGGPSTPRPRATSPRLDWRDVSSRPLPPLHRLAPRTYYGWVVALGVSAVSFVVVGIGFYGMVVFLNELCAQRGWSRSAVSSATSLYWMVAGTTGSLIGRSVDRHGARPWIAAGAVVMALGLLLLGRVRETWQVFAVYPVIAVGFAMAGTVPTSSIITRWFAARRARAMSVAQTGVSLGGMVLVPVATTLAVERGIATAAAVLAVVVVAVALPVAAGVLRRDPADHGLSVDGGAPPPPRVALDEAAQLRVWRRREALRTPTFALLAAAFGVMLFCQVAFALHELAFLRERLDARAAALAVSTTAGGSLVARLVVGSFADRVPKRALAAALFLLQAAALLGFTHARGAPALYAASLVFGFTIGNIFMMQALLVGELFGAASFGAVYGVLQLVTQIGSGLGPMALGVAFDRFGGYAGPVQVLAALAVGAALVISRVAPPAAQRPVATAS
jgi:sugar phosphate permease